MSEEIRVERTGRRPLVFHGRELGRYGSQWLGDVQLNRWHVITIYQTEAGKYVAHVAYLTQWQGEQDVDDAIHGTAETVADWLESYDPLQYLVGFPDRPQYEFRQRQLEASLRAQWAHALSDALDALGVEEHIE